MVALMSLDPSILLGHGHGFTSVLGLVFMISTTFIAPATVYGPDRVS